MTFLYNLLHILLLPAILLLLPIACLTKKNRHKIPMRMGLGHGKLPKHDGRDTIWVHALSLGEINSSLPLVKMLKEKYPTHRIIVSASTNSGMARAKEIMGTYTDAIIGAPFDFLPITHYYVKRLQPKIYIQVETDFWPNILSSLRQAKVPHILVNGRMSPKSMTAYRRFAPFFQPLFNSYTVLSMQTTADADSLVELGIERDKVLCLGNLKFAHTEEIDKTLDEIFYTWAHGKTVIVAGSTHPGEEEILCKSFKELQETHPELGFCIAPRNIARAKEIRTIAKTHGLDPCLRSEFTRKASNCTDLIVIDSLGELMSFYGLGHIAVVGGSFLDFGGHNPLEPARLGKAVLFGPYMTAFIEITDLLCKKNGAIQVAGTTLTATLLSLIENEHKSAELGYNALQVVNVQREGVLDRHFQTIDQVLYKK